MPIRVAVVSLILVDFVLLGYFLYIWFYRLSEITTLCNAYVQSSEIASNIKGDIFPSASFKLKVPNWTLCSLEYREITFTWICYIVHVSNVFLIPVAKTNILNRQGMLVVLLYKVMIALLEIIINSRSTHILLVMTLKLSVKFAFY